MANYRIIGVERTDSAGTVVSRFKCQRKGWFFWRDLKHFTHLSLELGPLFSTTWHDSLIDARHAIYQDNARRNAVQNNKTRVIEEVAL